MSDRLKVIDKIQKLFSKAENTDSAEEAATFFAAAQTLLTRYALTRAEIEALGAEKKSGIVKTVQVRINNPFSKQKQSLISGIARANGVKVVVTDEYVDHFKRAARQGGNSMWSRSILERDPDRKPWADPVNWADGEERIEVPGDKKSVKFRTVYLTGFEEDVDSTLLLFASLQAQAAREMLREDVPSYVNVQTFRRHFFAGFAAEIRKRLAQATSEATKVAKAEAAERGVDLLPVLVDRTKQVESAYEARWKGNLSKARSSYSSTYTGGVAAGRAAGARANVGAPSIGGRAALGRG